MQNISSIVNSLKREGKTFINKCKLLKINEAIPMRTYLKGAEFLQHFDNPLPASQEKHEDTRVPIGMLSASSRRWRCLHKAGGMTKHEDTRAPMGKLSASSRRWRCLNKAGGMTKV